MNFFWGVSVELHAQQADYTLESALKKLYDWGRTSVGYSTYKAEKNVKTLLESLIGSSILIEYIKIDPREISVSGNGEFIYTVNYRFNKLIDELKFSENFEVTRLRETDTPEYFMEGKEVYIALYTSTNQLAIELTEITPIKVFGRIEECGIYLPFIGKYVYVAVDVITWSKL